MTDQGWVELGDKVEPSWGPGREFLVKVGIKRRAARQRTIARVGTSIAVLALVAGGAGAYLRLQAPASTTVASSAAPPTAVEAVEAVEAVVTHLSQETVLEPMPEHRGRGFALRSGGARFVVPHDEKRPFVVVARDVVIEDLGTTFTVQYLSGDRLDISVEDGRVKVRARGVDREIAAGDRLEVSVAPLVAPSPSTGPAMPSWRPLAERGRYDEAHRALKKAGPNAVRDQTADLLLAADAARLGGYPAEAVPYLQRIVRAHSSDPRSSLAAFTLGRVLLDELGRPREAADAFARARVAGGPLAEDALAREVEAASRAGDMTRSLELAREYQKLYPMGRRAKAVSRFGGLD